MIIYVTFTNTALVFIHPVPRVFMACFLFVGSSAILLLLLLYLPYVYALASRVSCLSRSGIFAKDILRSLHGCMKHLARALDIPYFGILI